MPSVTVVLKNGTSVMVDGANDADWVQVSASGPMHNDVLLYVYLREPNKEQVRGKFRNTDVAGFSIDTR